MTFNLIIFSYSAYRTQLGDKGDQTKNGETSSL